MDLGGIAGMKYPKPRKLEEVPNIESFWQSMIYYLPEDWYDPQVFNQRKESIRPYFTRNEQFLTARCQIFEGASKEELEEQLTKGVQYEGMAPIGGLSVAISPFGDKHYSILCMQQLFYAPDPMILERQDTFAKYYLQELIPWSDLIYWCHAFFPEEAKYMPESLDYEPEWDQYKEAFTSALRKYYLDSWVACAVK